MCPLNNELLIVSNYIVLMFYISVEENFKDILSQSWIHFKFSIWSKLYCMFFTYNLNLLVAMKIAKEADMVSKIHCFVCISRFAGKTVSSGCLVLVSVALNDPDAVITINTEKTVIGSMLLRQFKTALTNSGP